MSGAGPSETRQLEFLSGVQRLLDEGQFTATYKFALLAALVDIDVERGRDDDEPLPVPLLAIAEKFVEYFWGHTRPYRGVEPLYQNKGRNIALLTLLAQAQEGGATTLAEVRKSTGWPRLLEQAARQVESMPLFRLQTLRGGVKHRFLYEESLQEGAIVLLPGVGFCLRRFASFVRSLARSGWLREVRANARNAYVIGESDSLEEFLFGTGRVALGAAREILLPLQEGRCFYCGERVGTAAHVDHFVPFALYPGSLAHNLVVAHAQCNTDKSDLLADLPHLDRWRERNLRSGDELAAAMAERGVTGSLPAAEGVARWAYGRARDAGALLWVGRREVRPFPRAAPLPF